MITPQDVQSGVIDHALRYAQPIQPLPDSLIRHMRFLSSTTPSTQIYLDRADDPGCNQQR